MTGFSSLDGVDEEVATKLVEECYLSYDDLSVIEPDDLMEMSGLRSDDCQKIISQARAKAERRKNHE